MRKNRIIRLNEYREESGPLHNFPRQISGKMFSSASIHRFCFIGPHTSGHYHFWKQSSVSQFNVFEFFIKCQFSVSDLDCGVCWSERLFVQAELRPSAVLWQSFVQLRVSSSHRCPRRQNSEYPAEHFFSNTWNTWKKIASMTWRSL